jgi:hypothetical protein
MEPGPLKCGNISPGPDAHSSSSQHKSTAVLDMPLTWETKEAHQPAIHDENLGRYTTLVELWEEALSYYRQTLSLSPDEKLVFESESLVTSHDHFRNIANTWTLFREGSKIGKLAAMKNRMERVVRVLYGKITTIDAMIGYPTQAVCLSRNLN